MSSGVILLVQPELEHQPSEWFGQAREQFPKARIIGLSSQLTDPEKAALSPLADLHSIELALEQEHSVDVQHYLNAGQDWLMIWEANERLAAAIDPGQWDGAVHKAHIYVQGDRIRPSWEERRLWSNAKPHGQPQKKDNPAIVFHKPLFYPAEKTGLSYRMPLKSDIQADKPLLQLKHGLHLFGSFRYKEAEQAFAGLSDSAYKETAQILSLLCCYNMGLIERALDELYEILQAEEEPKHTREAAYLFAYAAKHIEDPALRQQALEVLESYYDTSAAMQCLFTFDYDWLFLKGELLHTIGKTEEAMAEWKKSLEISDFTFAKAAYRAADELKQKLTPYTSDELARAVMDWFDLENRNAKRLLYMLLVYLEAEEWTGLFLRYHESHRWHSRQENDYGLVSIVLPIYNDTAHLHDAIRSLLNQTYTNFELLIVDDGSDEDIESFVHDFFWFDKRIKLLHLPRNYGLPHALNEGIRQISGEYFTWVSADNQLHPRWLERLTAALHSNPDHAGVISDYYHIDNDGRVFEKIHLKGYQLNGFQNSGPSFLWRRNTLRRAGLFDISMEGIEDRDYMNRVGMTGPVYHLPEKLCYYRIHEGSLSDQIGKGRIGGWEQLHAKLKQRWIFLQFC